MNKIIVVNDVIKEEVSNEISILKNEITVLQNTTIYLDFTNSINELKIFIKPNVNLEVISKNSNTRNKIKYILNEGSNLEVLHLGLDCKDQIIVDLNGLNARVNYRYSTINNEENTFVVNINHNVSKTYSSVINHGVNTSDQALTFDVNGTVLKTSSDCSCNQDNKIIELKGNYSSIKPNLWIDNYQVEANHAAYIGKFKEEDLFYLMSRGLEKKKCYELLLQAFLLPNEKIDDEIKEWFLSYLK